MLTGWASQLLTLGIPLCHNSPDWRRSPAGNVLAGNASTEASQSPFRFNLLSYFGLTERCSVTYDSILLLAWFLLLSQLENFTTLLKRSHERFKLLKVHDCQQGYETCCGTRS